MRQFFQDENPVGRRITWDRNPDDESTWHRIVGVVGDEHQYGAHMPQRSKVGEMDVYMAGVLPLYRGESP